MLHTIYYLKQEIEELKKANQELVNKLVVQAEIGFHRTFQLAIYGALPKPGTPEYKACGYVNAEANSNKEKDK
jgi:hypothetical protein